MATINRTGKNGYSHENNSENSTNTSSRKWDIQGNFQISDDTWKIKFTQNYKWFIITIVMMISVINLGFFIEFNNLNKEINNLNTEIRNLNKEINNLSKEINKNTTNTANTINYLLKD